MQFLNATIDPSQYYFIIQILLKNKKSTQRHYQEAIKGLLHKLNLPKQTHVWPQANSRKLLNSLPEEQIVERQETTKKVCRI